MIFLKIIDYNEAARAVNIVTYIPVEVATVGWIPMITSTGTNIAPGPIPQKAAAKAPKNEIISILIIPCDVGSKSPGMN